MTFMYIHKIHMSIMLRYRQFPDLEYKYATRYLKLEKRKPLKTLGRFSFCDHKEATIMYTITIHSLRVKDG